MATRLIGTDSANPRLPAVVITATQGTTADDLAPGDVIVDANAYADAAAAAATAGVLFDANAYTDAQLAAAVIDPAEVAFADNAQTAAGVATNLAVPPSALAQTSAPRDVRSYGVKGDGTTDDRAALAAIPAAASVIFPPGTYRIASNLTFTCQDVRFVNGAKIKPDSAIIFAIDGQVDAGLFQIFDLSAGGIISWTTNTRIGAVRPQWWGAAANGVADDTVPLQAAINSVNLGTGVPPVAVELGAGTYKITATITVTRRAVTLRGTGSGNAANQASNRGRGTTIKWEGAAGLPMITFADCRHCLVQDLYIQGDDVNVPSEGILLDNPGTSVGTNEHMVFERVLFGYLPWQTGGYNLGYCVRVGGTSNLNNDQFTFRNCQFLRPNTACVKIDNSQSIWGSFENCVFDANQAVGVKGLITAASTMLYNAQFNGCQIDIEVQGTAQVVVFGWQSENSAKLADIIAGGGRLIVRGGYVTFTTRLSAGFYITAPVLAGGCIDLDGWRLNTGTASPRPQLQVVGATMAGAAAGATSVVSVRNCTITPNDFAVSSLANGRVQVIVDDAQISDRVYLSGVATYTPRASVAGRPAVTGSRGGNAALASLLTQLASLGLIIDSSTA